MTIEKHKNITSETYKKEKERIRVEKSHRPCEKDQLLPFQCLLVKVTATVKVTAADWIHQVVRKPPGYKLCWVCSHLGSNRNAQTPPLSREFQLGDVILWISGHFGSLWHLPRRHICLLHQWVEAMVAHQQRQTPPCYVWVFWHFPGRGVNTAEFTGVRTETIPPHTGFASFLTSSNTSCSLRKAVLTLCASTHPPKCLNHWHFSLSSRITCGFSSLDLGQLDNIPFILSQVSATIPVPGIRHIWGGLGLSAHKCSPVSLHFAMVGKSPSTILEGFSH